MSMRGETKTPLRQAFDGFSFIIFSPALTDFLKGSDDAALLLAYFDGWNGKGWDQDGWIYKTGIEIEQETQLSRYKKDKAVALLINRGFLEKKLKDWPRRTYYKILYKPLLEEVKNWRISYEESDKSVGKKLTNRRARKSQANSYIPIESANNSAYLREVDREKELRLGRQQHGEFQAFSSVLTDPRFDSFKKSIGSDTVPVSTNGETEDNSSPKRCTSTTKQL